MNIDVTSLAMNWMAAYGAPEVAGRLFLGALGLPLPGTILVIASGAFIHQSLLDGVYTPLWGYLGMIAGDASLYVIGLLAGSQLRRRFGHTASWNNAHVLFERRGGIAIYLTRWLLTAISFPVTLIAGSSNYRFRKFFALAMLGELTWILLYGGLGYTFGSQWELISDFISSLSGFVLGAVVLAAGVFILVKFRKKPAVQINLGVFEKENDA